MKRSRVIGSTSLVLIFALVAYSGQAIVDFLCRILLIAFGASAIVLFQMLFIVFPKRAS